MKSFVSVFVLITLSYSTQSAAEPKDATKPRPFLIVPGQSIGKIVLGQDRTAVHRKMGSPVRSRSLKGWAGGEKDDKNVVELIEDVWQRTTTPEEKRKREKFLHDAFSVYYMNNHVVQVTISLSGYATADGLSIESTFDQFEKRFGEAVKSQWNLDPDGGISHTMVSIWDFQQKGLAIESNFYGGGTSPREVLVIYIHKPSKPYLFVYW